MAVEILGVFIPILAVIGTIVAIIFIRKYENTERMAMIEKGVDPKIFTKKPNGPSLSPSFSLRVSLLFMGIGLGLLIGHLLVIQYNLEEPVAYFSQLFLFGGLGLGISYIVEEKKRKEQEKE